MQGEWCVYSHGDETSVGGGGKATGQGNDTPICKYFLEGKCFAGSQCTFSHGEEETKGGGFNWFGGPGRLKDGDWFCPACSDHQYGRNIACRKCGEPRPEGKGLPEKGDKGKDSKGKGKKGKKDDDDFG